MPVLRMPVRDDRRVFERVGINNASTKKLFCSQHDSELFSPLEAHSFTVTAQNALLLHFRAVCSEFAAKFGANLLRSTVRIESDGSPEGDAAVAEWELVQLGQELGLRDIATHYWRTLQAVRQSDTTAIRYLVCEFASKLPYAFAGSFMPEFDFRGRSLVDLADTHTPPDAVSISAFSDGERGYLALTWEKGANHSQTLASSLLHIPGAQKSEAGLILGLEHLENTCLSPDWWEALSNDQRGRHESRFRASAETDNERLSTCLAIESPTSVSVGYTSFKSNDGALILLT